MLIVRIWEGLGNQMFQYAFARALSLRRHEEVKLDVEKIFDDRYTRGNAERSYGLNSFRIQLSEAGEEDLQAFSFLGCRSLMETIRCQLATHRLGEYQFYEETKENFAPNRIYISRNCYIKGWFQSDRYFKQYRKIILDDLSPKKDIQLSEKLKNILSSQKTVSVHIRRGDYVKMKIALPNVYYYNCFRYIRDHVGKDCTYLVFTDDPVWVRRHIEFPESVYYVSEEESLKDYEELIVMSRCMHNIIANSTFSWWGAWLNQNPDKTVIAPKRWFLEREYQKDICITPGDWIRL